MRTLFQAIEYWGDKNAPALCSHLSMSGIEDWGDCTRVKLCEFVAYLQRNMSQSSAHTYTARLRAVLTRYKDEDILPFADFNSVLKCKNERSQKTYLDESELKALELVLAKNERERFVQLCFLISARTGMRISDTLRTTEENVKGDILDYVSKKTSIEAQVPVSDDVKNWITEVNEIKYRPTEANYNLIIKRLCKRAGINERVKLFKRGKEMTGEKWQFVSSHTARVSFCTCLSQHLDLNAIATLAGHTNPIMTANYVVRTRPELNDGARRFFGQV